MHAVVVGAGIVGVTTAYYLRRQGFEVTVLERRDGVAREASAGNAGVIAPAYVGPWPHAPWKLLSYLVERGGPTLIRPRLDPGQWRWLLRWFREAGRERFLRNKRRMQRVARYSRALLGELRQRHQIVYDQTRGYLQLYRTAAALARGASVRALLEEVGAPHELLDGAGCRRLEPALAADAPLAGGLLLPEDETGDCAAFARRLQEVCAADGVSFRFDAKVRGIEARGGRVTGLRTAEGAVRGDAYVVAAGAESGRLLRPLVRLPLYPVKGYSVTVAITEPARAPQLSVMDEVHKVAITRMGDRLRVAGIAEVGGRALRVRPSALRALCAVAERWFPGAGAYAEGEAWVGARPMSPDGPPVLGATPAPNLFVNVGHGSSGWAMACGAAKVVADVVAGRTPEIDLEGLTIDRYRAGR